VFDPRKHPKSKKDGRFVGKGKSEGTKPSRMPGAEAKSKKPKCKKYQRVRAAERYAREELGVEEANYAKRIEIANVSNHGLFVCLDAGAPLPRHVRVEAMQPDDPDKVILAAYEPSLSGEVGSVIINGAASEWDNIAEFARQRHEEHDISTGDERHFIVHELGELAFEQSAGIDNANPLGTNYAAVEEQFQQEDMAHIYEMLGDRATHSHGEFVAEMFAGIMLGRADELHADEALMELYRKYGGEDLLKYHP
jgi:hypothetical protein